MKYAIVDPKARTVEPVEADDVLPVYVRAGFPPGKVDHGVLWRLPDRAGLGYVVYEFGLFVPIALQHYWALAGKLIAGAAVLYQFDQVGETVDLDPARWPIEPRWFASAAEVEAAIEAGEVERPAMRVNGSTIWEWPQAAPELAEEAMKHQRNRTD